MLPVIAKTNPFFNALLYSFGNEFYRGGVWHFLTGQKIVDPVIKKSNWKETQYIIIQSSLSFDVVHINEPFRCLYSWYLFTCGQKLTISTFGAWRWICVHLRNVSRHFSFLKLLHHFYMCLKPAVLLRPCWITYNKHIVLLLSYCVLHLLWSVFFTGITELMQLKFLAPLLSLSWYSFLNHLLSKVDCVFSFIKTVWVDVTSIFGKKSSHCVNAWGKMNLMN